MIKRYLYKVYRGGEFVGTLPVSSEFEYSQDINTGGAMLRLEIPLTLDDTDAQVVAESVTDHLGDPVTDHLGEDIFASIEYVFANTPIDLGNRVLVQVFYDELSAAPATTVNGVNVFDGLVRDFEEDEKRKVITLTIVGYGVQLENYPVTADAGTDIVTQSFYIDGYNLRYEPKDPPITDGNIVVGQSFQLPIDSLCSGIIVAVQRNVLYAGPQSARLTVYKGLPQTGTPLATVSRSIVTQTGMIWNRFTFPSTIQLEGGVQYSFALELEDYAPFDYPIVVGRNTSNPYADGQVYRRLANAGWVTDAGSDLTFRVIAAAGSFGAVFTNQDPSNIIKKLLDGYNDMGGVITYDASSIELTGGSESMTFRTNTVHEGITTALDLAPSNWYWYVDPGTKLLHFHRASTTPDHTFVKGVHLENFKLKYTLEHMRNAVLYNGGDDGSGDNLLIYRTNAISNSKYGSWLDRRNDVRVADQETAETLARGILNQYSEPVWQTEVTIPAARYDIETLMLGQMVGFQGYGNLKDQLRLQIVGLTKRRYSVTLRLGTNPPNASYRVRDIKRELDNLYAANNPTTIS